MESSKSTLRKFSSRRRNWNSQVDYLARLTEEEAAWLLKFTLKLSNENEWHRRMDCLNVGYHAEPEKQFEPALQELQVILEQESRRPKAGRRAV